MKTEGDDKARPHFVKKVKGPKDVLSVRVTPALRKSLEKLAAEEQTSLTGAAVGLLEWAISRYPPKGK